MKTAVAVALAMVLVGMAVPALAAAPTVAVGVWGHDYIVDLVAPLRDSFTFHIWYAVGTDREFGSPVPEGIAWADISAPLVGPVSVFVGGVYVYHGGDIHIAPALGARVNIALNERLHLRVEAARIPVDEVEIGGADAGIWTGYEWAAALRYAPPNARWFVEAGNRVLRFDGPSTNHQFLGPYALVGIAF